MDSQVWILGSCRLESSLLDFIAFTPPPQILLFCAVLPKVAESKPESR
ncbi:hypothetical protein [Helicobacter sp. CLO-3]|nr:hypothetical protein [Helicobacter sp. CLO-3]